MHITERTIEFGLQILMIIGLAAITLMQLNEVDQTLTIIRAGCILLLSIILILHQRGLSYTNIAFIMCGCIIITLAIDDETFSPSNAYAMLMPSLAALVLSRPRWIVTTAIITPLLLLARADAFIWRAELAFWILYSMIIGSFVLAWILLDLKKKHSGR